MSNEKGGSVLKTCGIGCLIVLVLAAVATVLLVRKLPQWGADVARRGMVSAIEMSEMPEDQKKAVIVRINRIVDEFKDGDITIGQLGTVAEEVAMLVPVIMVNGFDSHYVADSTLDEEAKKAASLTCQRFARGLLEKKIPNDAMEELQPLMMEKGPDGQDKLKKKLTDAELEQVLAKMKVRADEAKIPSEPFTIDYAVEIDKAIAKAKGIPTTQMAPVAK